MLRFIPSYDNNFYVCKTCTHKIEKNKVPCKAAWNKLQVYDFLKDLGCIWWLEKVLIARRFQFEKIIIMPKGKHLN